MSFVVRPSNSEKEKEAFRVKLSAASLLGLKLKFGDVCMLTRSSEDGGAELGLAIVWDAPSGIKDNVIQTSKVLQELYGFKLGDKLSVARYEAGIEDARIVKLAAKDDTSELDAKLQSFWECYAGFIVKTNHEYLAVGQHLTFKVGPELQTFDVVDPGTQGAARLTKVTNDTQFEIVRKASIAAPSREKIEIPTSKLQGLQDQVREAAVFLNGVIYPSKFQAVAPTQGILIYGIKGVGKSHFVQRVSEAGWASTIQWRPGSKIPIPKLPTLVVIRRSDMPSPQAAESRLEEFDTLFNAMRGYPCMIVGEANHPNDIHPRIRSKQSFGVEIEIPIPSAPQRRKMLAGICSNNPYWPDKIITEVADRTHGFVAADLETLLERIAHSAATRTASETSNGVHHTDSLDASDTDLILSFDVTSALSRVRPSALQEIFLETPSTTWADIGGQHDTKRLLTTAVSRPLKQADSMDKLGLPPKKGLLMYGPPGCSKTLLVRALAREAGLNFLAVKGAELISQYVGESERAVRGMFRKAKQASPSIIFFDEIDSIAARGRPGSELNVLTTLLNEMDGFEELKGVFVVAATNKPEVIDPALLRPGRFDEAVYIPPPDEEGRKEILMKQFLRSGYVPRYESTVEEDAVYFSKKTEGFSGSEIVGIRYRACEAALDEDRDWYGYDDMERSVERQAKGITRNMLEGFERWQKERLTIKG